MDWRTRIKESRENNPNRHNRAPERKKPQTKLVGGEKRNKKAEYGGYYGESEPFGDTEEDRFTREYLANSTRFDLMEKVQDMLDKLTDDELIDILITSQGEVGLLGIDIEDRR